jgi:chromosome segregation ATPase
VRIHRIRLKNFCGVVESEACFAPRGVTIVEGPNEVGKSTLLQALDLLFDYRDDSRSEDVRAAKPVDRDVGAEVMVDLEMGGCDLTYFKRFNRDCETRLSVRTPKAENLTGREAHDRVQQLLDESLDTALWKALRFVQGEKVELPDLKGQPALAQALDRAAGQARAGDREETLFDAARTEYLKYWTEKGKEREDPLRKARTAAIGANAAAKDLRHKLTSLEADISRYASLDREVADARASVGGLEESFVKLENAWDGISKLQSEVERLRVNHQAAGAAARAAQIAEEERQRLAESAREGARRVDALTATGSASEPAMERAVRELDAAREARNKAKEATERAEKEEVLRRKDRDFRHAELELARMEERLARIRAAEKAAVKANEVLARLPITGQGRRRIRDAEVEAKKARARLEASASQLHVKALKDVEVVLDGAPTKLACGEERSLPVPETVTVRLADAVEVRVSPGTSDTILGEKLVAIEKELASACEEAGIASPDEAETAWATRQEAERALAARDRVVEENLRDLTRDDLEKRIESTRTRIQSYQALRQAVAQLPPNLDEAIHQVARAENDAERAKSERNAAEEVFEAARHAHDQLREAAAVDAALLDQARKDMERFNIRLAGERAILSDETLVEKRQAADGADREAAQALASAARLLVEADPDGATERLTAAREARKKAKTRLVEFEGELVRLRSRLETLGEQGLAEALALAERACLEADDALARLLRRAEAAQLLHDTLASERDAARRAYVAPLREGTERLGRHVFGPTFRIEVDDELQVVTRTLEGTTVPFESLSTGAREQLGLLVRVAAALVVAKEGGVPLVLDDALGSTDPGRLEGIGAVLSLAGRQCQVIVLTCSPERYVHVDAAARVRLEAVRST